MLTFEQVMAMEDAWLVYDEYGSQQVMVGDEFGAHTIYDFEDYVLVDVQEDEACED